MEDEGGGRGVNKAPCLPTGVCRPMDWKEARHTDTHHAPLPHRQLTAVQGKGHKEGRVGGQHPTSVTVRYWRPPAPPPRRPLPPPPRRPLPPPPRAPPPPLPPSKPFPVVVAGLTCV